MTLPPAQSRRMPSSFEEISARALEARAGYQEALLPSWARPLRGWSGRSVEVAIGPPAPPFAEPSTLVEFNYYGSEELHNVVGALGCEVDHVQLEKALNGAAREYRNLRNDFERYLVRANRRSKLLELRQMFRTLRQAERRRGAVCQEYLDRLASGEDQVEIQLLDVDPFTSLDSHVSNMFRRADPSKRQFPEAVFVAELVTVYSSATGQQIGNVEIGRVRAPGKFMAFAWECTHRFRNRIGENTIISLANKAKRAL